MPEPLSNVGGGNSPAVDPPDCICPQDYVCEGCPVHNPERTFYSALRQPLLAMLTVNDEMVTLALVEFDQWAHPRDGMERALVEVLKPIREGLGRTR